eukprot:jgi/Mesen1/10491/ME000083S09997
MARIPDHQMAQNPGEVVDATIIPDATPDNGAGPPHATTPVAQQLTGNGTPTPTTPAAEENAIPGPAVGKSSGKRKSSKAGPKATPAKPDEEGKEKKQTASLTAYTVQCARCFKWRKVPSLEQYEAIRAHLREHPFTCERARDWKPDVSCEDPPDMEQDGTYLWAMDRPDIPQPPPGWRRRIVVRGGTTSKFSDVYYHSPCGKSLRSSNDVEKFLSEHPQYGLEGITVKHFSFSSPRPMPASGGVLKQSKKGEMGPPGDAAPRSNGKRTAVTPQVQNGSKKQATGVPGQGSAEGSAPALEGPPAAEANA